MTFISDFFCLCGYSDNPVRQKHFYVFPFLIQLKMIVWWLKSVLNWIHK